MSVVSMPGTIGRRARAGHPYLAVETLAEASALGRARMPGCPKGALAVIAFVLAALVAAPQAPEAEVRVVEYLKANVRPGQPVVLSELYNSVFAGPDERAALNRLFNTFFKMPLYVAQHQKAAGKPPTLAEISEQFRFLVPGEADVMLRIMESDPRMPKFLTRDPGTGEITSVDVEKILAHPRFGKALERTITGWEGRPAPAFSTTTDDGQPLASEALVGKPHLLYFWFTGCPPCVRISPLLAELEKAYAAEGFRIVGLNADRVLELPYTDADRAAYAKKNALGFTLAHMTAEAQEAYGAVSVFPTMFFVDAKGTIVRHFVNFQEKAVLEEAVKAALQ
jgi:thiol-disulfide isomerase/thioredoxin